MALSVTVPDTITSWIATAFAMSNSSGLGISKPSSLKVFQPFFVSLTLPYSVIRGEEVSIIATVFNYESKCLTVSTCCHSVILRLAPTQFTVFCWAGESGTLYLFLSEDQRFWCVLLITQSSYTRTQAMSAWFSKSYVKLMVIRILLIQLL